MEAPNLIKPDVNTWDAGGHRDRAGVIDIKRERIAKARELTDFTELEDSVGELVDSTAPSFPEMEFVESVLVDLHRAFSSQT